MKDNELTPAQLRMTTLVAIPVIAFLLTFLLFFFDGWGQIQAGTRGVMTRMGAVIEVKDEGFYTKWPIIDRVTAINVQTQKVERQVTAASKDLQDVATTVALNYRIAYDKVGDMYKDIGPDIEEKVIIPVIEETVKSATANFTAEELITKRSEVRSAIIGQMKEKLDRRYVVVEDLNIINFSFSKAFTEAIENKVTQEQNALAEQNKLKTIEFQAQQAVAEAEGKAQSVKIAAGAEAEAIKIRGDALASNPEVVQLNAVEKWNGTLPTFMGGDSVPFISIPTK